jgi:hypothetical protein
MKAVLAVASRQKWLDWERNGANSRRSGAFEAASSCWRARAHPSAPPSPFLGAFFGTAAEALRRGADFWAQLLSLQRWQPGPVLKVLLDEGLDLIDLRVLNPKILDQHHSEKSV